MELLHYLRNAVVNLFKRRRMNDDLEEELKHHLAMAEKSNLEAGMKPTEARRDARVEFGGVEKLREECRDAWGARLMRDTLHDFRYAARSLGKSRGFSLAVIGTIALCIGANATIFSVLNGFVLNPLPFKNSDRIVQFFKNFRGFPPLPDSRISWNQYLDYKERQDLFEEMALSKISGSVLDDRLDYTMTATPSFFDVMDVGPLLGRFFTSEEVRSGTGDVAVLTQSEWETEYGSDPNIVGKRIRTATSAPLTVVGVAPRSLEVFNSQISLIRPIIPTSGQISPQARLDTFDLWARLQPGVSRALVAAEVNAIEARWVEEIADAGQRKHNEDYPSLIEIGRAKPYETALLMLQGGTLVLLIVGLVNLLNLMVGRANRRSQELFMRRTLGAGRFAIARMMLAESLLLAFSGVAAGLALAVAGLQVINRALAILLPTRLPIALDGTVAFWTLVTAAAIAFVLGLLPIWVLGKSGRLQHAEGGVRNSSASNLARKLSGGLVVSQFALTFTLLVGAGLLFRSLQNVLDVDPGFDAPHLVRGTVLLHPREYNGARVIETRRRILESMRNIPGVDRVAFLGNEKLVGQEQNLVKFLLGGDSVSEYSEAEQVVIQGVGEHFFSTMGIPILQGRPFRPGDDEASGTSSVRRTSVIVDQSFVDRYIKDQSAVGSELNLEFLTESNGTRHFMPVLGVAGRANYQGLDARDGVPVVYVSLEHGSPNRFTVVVRTTRPAEIVIGEMRTKLREIDPTLYMFEAAALKEQMDKLHLDRQGIAWLSVVFAGLALLLSAIGIYGVLSYDVLQRRRELGIRLALGATHRNVVAMVLRQGLWKAGLGLALGVFGAVALSRYISSLLFDISSLDPLTHVAAFVGLFLVGLTASFIPARRATQIDPVIALRAE